MKFFINHFMNEQTNNKIISQEIKKNAIQTIWNRILEILNKLDYAAYIPDVMPPNL